MRRWTILEAFFKEDQEIREWIDLFVEKLLTVNLLSGNEADGEFHQGRQAIEKIASSFQEMLDLPKEVLMDGIRQLVEQRLPDHRVIENFPDFYRLMNDMISAGLQNVEMQEPEYFPQPLAHLRVLGSQAEGITVPSSKVPLNGGGAQTKELDSFFSLKQHVLKTTDSPQTLSPKEPLNKGPATNTEPPPTYTEVDEKKELMKQEPLDQELSEDIKNKSGSNELGFSPNSNPSPAPAPDPDEMDKGIDDAIDEVIGEPLTDPIAKSLHELIDESLKQLLLESHSVIDEYTSVYTQPLENLEPDSKDEVHEEAVPSLSVLTALPRENEPVKSHGVPPARDPFRFNANKKKNNRAVIEPAVKPAAAPQEIPQSGKALAQVLKHLCGDAAIQWNVSVDEYSFFAKIDNILIRVISEDDPSLDDGLTKEINVKMKKQGYKVFACSQEDLMYPRRLEREIRRVLR
ncbi:hypothetical protein AT727_05600 [Desulfitobacterium hafniense]|uniref:Uncharacterized protein n=1 Tax=Desulfitobacterium hafniense TaxID=49338 RepID=A0A0W1JHH8_DESHA|nr:hypothetical protein [Desulfitobacterium hafniense]KTE91076.1 hypothetical protein AT727_05600 [Desulfitobacterium hafniense]